jgi:hypothetical protein
MKPVLSACIVLACLLLNSLVYAEKPGFHFNRGDVFRLNIRSEQTILQTIMDKPQLVENNIESELVLHVRAVLPDEIYLVDLKYEHMSMQEKSPFGDIQGSSIDSAGVRDMLYIAFQQLTAVTMSMKINSLGEVQAFSGIDTVMATVFTPFTQLTEQSRISLKDALQKSFGDEAILSYLQQLSGLFPKKQVKVGDKWNSQAIIAGGMYGMMYNTFSLVSSQGGQLVISQQGQVKQQKKSDFQQINGIRMKFSMEGSLNGEYALTISNGWIRTGKLVQEVKGIVTLEGTPQLPSGIKYPIEIHTTTQFTGE